MSTNQKLIAAGALLSAWLLMVVCGMAPSEGLVGAIRDALISLGAVQAALTDPKG